MKKFDIMVIGMGPAGMAVTAMGAAMGLSVLSIEKDRLGRVPELRLASPARPF